MYLFTLQSGNSTFIGCYYQPNMNLDDIISDICCALSKAKNLDSVIFGGDFNMKVNSNELREVENIFDQHSMYLRSDPTIATYVYSNGSSSIDHIFMSRKMDSPSYFVHNAAISDHLPISTTIRLKRNLDTRNNPIVNQKLDLAQAKNVLSNTDSITVCPDMCI